MRQTLLPFGSVLLGVALIACSSGPVPVGGALPPSASSTAAIIPPPVVIVDSDKTMSVDAGQGVGVFVEYQTGGNWHVWWTCDTAQTRQNCHYAVNIKTLDQSTITLSATDGLASADSVRVSNGNAVQART